MTKRDDIGEEARNRVEELEDQRDQSFEGWVRNKVESERRRGVLKGIGLGILGSMGAGGAGAALWEAIDDDGDTIYNIVNNEYNNEDESSPPQLYTDALDYRSELVVEEFFESNEGILGRDLTPSDIEIGENYLEGDFENGERLNYRQENSFNKAETEYMASIEDEEDLEYAFKPLF